MSSLAAARAPSPPAAVALALAVVVAGDVLLAHALPYLLTLEAQLLPRLTLTLALTLSP